MAVELHVDPLLRHPALGANSKIEKHVSLLLLFLCGIHPQLVSHQIVKSRERYGMDAFPRIF